MPSVRWPPAGQSEEFEDYLRRLHNRTARLERLHSLQAPDIILLNEAKLVALAAAKLAALTSADEGVRPSQMLRQWADKERFSEAGIHESDLVTEPLEEGLEPLGDPGEEGEP